MSIFRDDDVDVDWIGYCDRKNDRSDVFSTDERGWSKRGKDEEVNQWLGGRIEWGRLESNRMTREFYRVVMEIEKTR